MGQSELEEQLPGKNPRDWHCSPAGQVVHMYEQIPPAAHVMRAGQSESDWQGDVQAAFVPGSWLQTCGDAHAGVHVVVGGGGAAPSFPGGFASLPGGPASLPGGGGEKLSLPGLAASCTAPASTGQSPFAW
jgi:hypothetical protein